MTVERLARPLATLALFGVAVLLTTLAIVQVIQSGTHPRLLADALTLDLIVTVPLVYWFLAVRRAGWPRLSVLPVFVLSVAGTRLVGDERQVVELDSELVAVGLYGIRRRVRSIGLSVDEPERFLRCLEQRLQGPAS